MQTIQMKVSGMSCQHCVDAIQRALLGHEGVGSAVVDLEHNRAIVQYDDQIVQPPALLAAVREAGYEAELAKQPQPVS